MGEIIYAENYKVFWAPVKRRGMNYPGQNAMGYGNRIATDRKIKFEGDHRLYRVYCTCWSNSGTCYVVRRGVHLYCRASDLVSIHAPS